MSNEFYTKSGNPAHDGPGTSATMRAEFSLLEGAFDKMPTMTGNPGYLVRINASATGLEAVAPSSASSTIVYHGLGGDVTNSVYGNSAMAASTTDNNCVAVGYEALKVQSSGGHDNVAVGYQSMKTNTGAGNYNTAAGSQSLFKNFSGDNNVAIGSQAGYSISLGSSNIAIGANTLSLATAFNGDNNVAIGSSAMLGASGTLTAANNVAIGTETLKAATSGSNNVAIGHQVGSVTLATGGNNILIGTSSSIDTPASGTNNWISLNNKLVINAATAGSEAIGINRSTTGTPGSTALIVGSAATNGNGASLTAAGTWTNASDERIKQNIQDVQYGLSSLLQLRPVAYEMRGTAFPQIGFVAQEVLPIIPEVVHVPSDIENEHYGISYGNLVAVVVKAIQELNSTIITQNAIIQAFEARISALETPPVI